MFNQSVERERLNAPKRLRNSWENEISLSFDEICDIKETVDIWVVFFFSWFAKASVPLDTKQVEQDFGA